MAASDPDAVNNADSAAVSFTCNQPPDCSEASASPDTLWPPNNKMTGISIVGVTDPDGDTVTLTVTSIMQDEVVNKGPTANGVGTSSPSVMAQRRGGGNGRVYHIFFTAEDGFGGSCDGEVTVCVPHDQGRKQGSTCTDSGSLHSST